MFYREILLTSIFTIIYHYTTNRVLGKADVSRLLLVSQQVPSQVACKLVNIHNKLHTKIQNTTINKPLYFKDYKRIELWFRIYTNLFLL